MPIATNILSNFYIRALIRTCKIYNVPLCSIDNSWFAVDILRRFNIYRFHQIGTVHMKNCDDYVPFQKTYMKFIIKHYHDQMKLLYQKENLNWPLINELFDSCMTNQLSALFRRYNSDSTQIVNFSTKIFDLNFKQ